MYLNARKTRILIFIGSIRAGGKERRLIELLNYLKNKDEYELHVVLTEDEIHYPAFFKLGIPYQILPKKWKKNDFTVFYQFYKLCKELNPDIIHTWGRMQTLYTLPVILSQGIPLVNGQITSAPPKQNKWSIGRLIDLVNFHFSTVVLSNSKAGLEAFQPPLHKSRVIYNGINMNRFCSLPAVDQVKLKYGITTPYTVVMSASFSPNKDYGLFYEVAKLVTQKRDDITFIGVGASHDDVKFNELLAAAQDNPRIIFPGRIEDVEALVNACDVGVLFSVNGEGISNSILEYMALSKPVIAHEAGGTKEIIYHGSNGYLITGQTTDEIVSLVINLIDDKEKCRSFGGVSRRIIEDSFTLDRMGKDFEQVYKRVLGLADKVNHTSVATVAQPSLRKTPLGI